MGEGARLCPLKRRPLSRPYPLADMDTFEWQARQGELAWERDRVRGDLRRESSALYRLREIYPYRGCGTYAASLWACVTSTKSPSFSVSTRSMRRCEIEIMRRHQGGHACGTHKMHEFLEHAARRFPDRDCRLARRRVTRADYSRRRALWRRAVARRRKVQPVCGPLYLAARNSITASSPAPALPFC